jgi:hypothetical protein
LKNSAGKQNLQQKIRISSGTRNLPRWKFQTSAGKLKISGKKIFPAEIQIFRWKNKTSAGNSKILRIF